MKGYVIAHDDVRDPEAYRRYTDRTPGVVHDFGGRFIVRGAPVQRMEGETDWKRLVVLEFPSLQRAREWYESGAYQAIIGLRQAVATSDLIIVEGYDDLEAAAP